jgi:hypothetical protein
MSGNIKLYNPGQATQKNLIGSFSGPDSVTAIAQRLDVNAYYSSTAAVNALRILISTGTFSGTVRIYGIGH